MVTNWIGSSHELATVEYVSPPVSTPKNPRLKALAADQLHAAADALVTHGLLLSPPEKQDSDRNSDSRTPRLAEACTQLACLDQPAVVSPAPSRTLIRIIDNVDPDHDRPARLLERHSEHRRVQALTALAANPHTPHAAVTDVLNGLHPAELAWITERAGGPDWFLDAAAAVPVDADENDGVLRLVSDDELGKHADPAAVLQSWLDSPPPARSSPAPRSTGPSSSPVTTPQSTCSRSRPMRSSPATNPRSRCRPCSTAAERARTGGRRWPPP